MKNNLKIKKNKKRNLILNLIIIACLVVCAFSVYQIIKIKLEYKHISDTNKTINASLIKEETPNNALDFSYDHEEALKINKDAKGFLYMPANNMRLPIVQAADNDFYLHRDFYCNYSRGGTLFIDKAVKDGINANYVIIYGHHMNDGSMLTPNNNYKDEKFYKTGTNDIFYILTPNSIRKYKIFAVFNVDPYVDDEFSNSVYSTNYSKEQLKKYAPLWKSHSFYDTGVDVSNINQVVMLSSCEATDYRYRLVVMGTLIEEVPK